MLCRRYGSLWARPVRAQRQRTPEQELKRTTSLGDRCQEVLGAVSASIVIEDGIEGLYIYMLAVNFRDFCPRRGGFDSGNQQLLMSL